MRTLHCRLLALLVAIAVPAVAVPAVAGAQASRVAPRLHDPDSLKWRPAGPRAEIATVDGNPQGDGEYAIAIRFAAGGMIPPHFHPKDTRVVVVRGQVYVGFGDEPDTARTRPLGPGGYALVPADAHHFEAGKTDALVIIYGTGPLKTTMVKPGASHP
jgi:quercetin dioxygenase-like cupin family protein